MKKTALIVLMTLSIGGVAQALEISFSDMDPHEGSVDSGILAFGQTLGQSAVITSLSYTVTGLTIDSDGAADDQITVTFSVSGFDADGVENITWDLAKKEFDHNGSSFSVAEEGISFGAIGVTGILSSGDSLAVNSAVYDGFALRRWDGNETITIAGDQTASYDYDGAGTSVTLSNDTTFSITHKSGTFWNLDDIGFTVDVAAIPEPDTYALLAGCFGLAWVMLRRR
mgnify:CR=1 FL=1